MNLMERFADPGVMHDMTVGEKMIGSGVTTLMGMGVTFVVLIFLWGCLALMVRVMSGKGGKRRPMQAPEVESVVESEQLEQGSFGSVHRAVIAAAVAAYDGGAGSLVVGKIRRLPSRPVWAGAAQERKVCK